MSFEAAVETYYGERLLLWHSDGLPGGKPIAAFLNVLMNYCSGDDVDLEVKQWFAQLESASEQPICELTKPLQRAFYHGFWNYREDEYERFLAHSRDMPLSKAEFQQTLRFVESRWVSAEELLNMLNTFVALLKQANLEVNWWYHPEHTLEDFVVLKQTVEIARRAGRETKIRIQFF